MSSSYFSSAGDNLSFSGFLDNILIDFPPQSQDVFTSGSDNSAKKTNSSTSASTDGETNQWEISLIEERKRKRLVSNRESAKRSRARKQNQLENLMNQLTQYTSGNQELINRLRFVNNNGRILRRENERLRLESVMLQQKLHNLRQLLLVRRPELHHQPLLSSAWPCNNNVTTINDQQNQTSLITF